MELEQALALFDEIAADSVQTEKNKHLRTAGVISAYVHARIGVMLTVVGGLSVELYTDGGYMTADVDFVGPNHQGIMDCLEELGYVSLSDTGKNVLGGSVMRIHAKLNSLVEVPSEGLKNADEERVNKIVTPDGLILTVIGIEDIVADRIRASLHYKETVHYEYIAEMLERHRQRMDFDYLYNVLTDDEQVLMNDFFAYLDEDNNTEEQLALIRHKMLSQKYQNADILRISSDLEHLIVFNISSNAYIGFTTTPAMNLYRYNEEEDQFVYLDEEVPLMTLEEVEEWLLDPANTNGFDFTVFLEIVRDIIEGKADGL